MQGRRGEVRRRIAPTVCPEFAAQVSMAADVIADRWRGEGGASVPLATELGLRTRLARRHWAHIPPLAAIKTSP